MATIGRPHGPARFDWVVRRALAGSSHGEIPSGVAIEPWVDPLGAEELTERLRQWSIRADIGGDANAVLEIAMETPMRVEAYRDGPGYSALLPTGASLSAWASRYPHHAFYQGTLADFAKAFAGRFGRVEAYRAPDDENPSLRERRLRALRALLRPAGAWVGRERPEASSMGWRRLRAALERLAFRVSAADRLPDGTFLIFAQRVGGGVLAETPSARGRRHAA